MAQYTIYKQLNLSTDKFTNTNKVTTGIWNSSAGTLNAVNMATASLSSSNVAYFRTVTEESGSSAVKSFDVSYGHVTGAGSSTTDYKYSTRVVYRQFANAILDDPLKKFSFMNHATGSNTAVTETDDFYAIVVKSAKIKDRLHTKWTMTLSGSKGTAAAPSGETLHLTNYTASVFPSVAGDYYLVISGSAGVPGESGGVAGTVYGYFFPDIATILLYPTKLSASLPGSTGYALSGSSGYYTGIGQGLAPSSATTANNSGKFLDVLMTNASSFTLRTEQDLNQTQYFCRLFSGEYNFTSNPTFIKSGSELGDLLDNQVGDPSVYITGVGLYNDHNELIAVAKVNEPIKKNFSTEQNFVVKIDG